MPLPIPLLDDLEWVELLEEGRDRLPAAAPDWTDHNIHDPGITILELLAWTAEETGFRIDQIPPSHRRRFLSMLGVELQPAKPARFVLELLTDGAAIDVPVGALVDAQSDSGTRLRFRVGPPRPRPAPDQQAPLTSGSEVVAGPARIVELLSGGRRSPSNLQPGQTFPLFSGHTETGSVQTDAIFRFDPGANGRLSLWFHLPTGPPVPNAHRHHSVVLRWAYRVGQTWTDLDQGDVLDGTAALSRSGFVDLNLPDVPTSPVTEIRARIQQGRYDRWPEIAGVMANAVEVEQTEEDDTPTMLGFVADDLTLPFDSDQVREVDDLLSIDSQQRETTWHLKSAPIGSPDEPVAVFHPETNRIIFSDGRWGRRPLADERFSATLRRTMGPAGNLVAQSTSWSFTQEVGSPPVPSVVGAKATGLGAPVETIGQAIGGAAAALWAHERLVELVTAHDGSSLDDIQAAAVAETRSPDRAVTVLDHERRALATPGVQLARVRAWRDLDLDVPCAKAPGTVSLVVVPFLPVGRPEPTNGLLRAVSAHLGSAKTLGTRLVIRGPNYIPVSIAIHLTVLDCFDPAIVQRQAEAAIRAFLDPLDGGPRGTGWPFGRDVYRTEVMASVADVDGLDLVTRVDLTAPGQGNCANICVPNGHLVSIESLLVNAGATEARSGGCWSKEGSG